mmetsp:Transcript_24192/g.56101  ORF Transcript_24192/g.56101 Transcript_24192/m.56101 type:complete len:114 (+) Transcript_24192:59-400(+)
MIVTTVEVTTVEVTEVKTMIVVMTETVTTTGEGGTTEAVAQTVIEDMTGVAVALTGIEPMTVLTEGGTMIVVVGGVKGPDLLGGIEAAVGVTVEAAAAARELRNLPTSVLRQA